MNKSGVITEGLASILPIETNEVFYNPVQVFNRDLSVLAVSVYARQLSGTSGPIQVLEGLAASGLRSIRYAKELKFGEFKIVANDIESVATERIASNVTHNGIGDAIQVSNADAISHMHLNKNVYSVIDLDPYGSCSLFLDAAVSSVKPGGLLCITSTDGGVLCGNQTDLAFIRYGGFSVKKNYSHEMGLRVMLHAILSAAARHKRGVKVLAAFSIDFYFRVFVQIIESPEQALCSMEKTGIIFQCINCEFHLKQDLCRIDGHNRKPARLSQPSNACPECESPLCFGGPIYTGPLWEDSKFIDACLDIVEDEQDEFPGISSWPKIKGLLYGLKSELPQVALFYTIPGLTSAVKLSPPKLKVFYHWLRQLGFQVSGSHRTPNAIKTDAPAVVVFDLLRIYAKKNCGEPHSNAPFPQILKKEITTKIPSEIIVDFNIKVEKEGEKIPIYIPNPTAFWGPKPMASSSSKKRKID